MMPNINNIKLSIIIPCYNEKNTILKLLDLVEEIKSIKKEIIVIDDCSSDGSVELIKNFKFKSEHKLIFHDRNKGKGSCIKSSQELVTGDIVLIQDADLEYHPNDYSKLIDPIITNKSNVVYGSRVLGKKRYSNKNFTSLFRIFANHMLTIVSNLVNRQKLSDAHTCYKVFRVQIFKKIELIENGFSFCPEVTTKLSNVKEKIIEVPISYNGRTYSEGKKINFADGIHAIKSIIKYKFFN